MNKLILIFFLLSSNILIGQTVILNEKPLEYNIKTPSEGPNFRHFNHIYWSFSFIAPLQNEYEIETNIGKSYIINLGWRYKFRITEILAVGTAVNLHKTSFNITQNNAKQVPNIVQHTKEKIQTNNLGTEVFIRINFGKRGNIIGKFIDFASYINYAFSAEHKFQDPMSGTAPYYAGISDVTLSDLSYIEKINYGLTVRIGLNRWVLTSSYRLSNLLTNEYIAEVGNYEFPRLSVGFEMGLHK